MGRPKGSKNKATLEREAQERAARGEYQEGDVKHRLEAAAKRVESDIAKSEGEPYQLGTAKPAPAPDVQVSIQSQAVQEELLKTKDLDKAKKIVMDRLRAGVFQSPSHPIRLKDPRMRCRWFNTLKGSNHLWRAKNYQGWTAVTPDMLADPDQVGGYSVQNGEVVRGANGAEHLMCMDKDLYRMVEQAKEGKAVETLGNPAKLKHDLATHMGATHGAEAGDFVNRNIIGEVTDSRSREEMPDEYREKV